MRATALTVSCILVLTLVVAAGCSDTNDWLPGVEAEAHHRPDHDGGPPGQGNNDNGNNDTDDGSCDLDSDCGEDEACTQGGRCINITGEESVLQQLQADIDELDDAVGMGVPYELPANARLLIDDDHGDGLGLVIDNAIMLDGNGSQLIVENDMIGVQLVNGSNDADWSSIKNLEIRPVDMSLDEPHDGVGIDVRAHGVRLENLRIRRMGTGIRAHTVVDGDVANVNTQQWSRIILQNNHHHGMHLESGDSNAGLFSGIEVHGGAGITDDSFLGNTYVAPVIQNDGEKHQSFNRVGNAGATTTLGMYVENSSAHPYSGAFQDLHVGGNAVRRFDTEGGRVGGMASRLRFGDSTPEEGHVGVAIPRGPHAPFAFSHGKDVLPEDVDDVVGPDTDDAITLYPDGDIDSSDSPGEWRLQYIESWDKWTILEVAHTSPAAYPFRWTGVPYGNDDTGLIELNKLED